MSRALYLYSLPPNWVEGESARWGVVFLIIRQPLVGQKLIYSTFDFHFKILYTELKKGGCEMETLVKYALAILGIIVGVLWSSFVVFTINWTSIGNYETFFEALISDPFGLLLLLPGLALIVFPLWYLFRLEMQKKEEE